MPISVGSLTVTVVEASGLGSSKLQGELFLTLSDRAQNIVRENADMKPGTLCQSVFHRPNIKRANFPAVWHPVQTQ